DFARAHALPLLSRYRDQLCCFNDDIQGTAAVCVGCLLAACKAKGERVSDQTIVFVGAGSAGCGIAEQIIVAMTDEGLPEAQARARMFMIDQNGLITDDMNDLPESTRRLAQPASRVRDWSGDGSEDPILSVVENAKPKVLIGVCGQRGIFSQQVIERMHAHCEQPFVMPLSNPTSKVEATPQEILDWTHGRALVATGSPFAPADVNGEKRPIAQCNNAYIFPGVGLGVLAARANRVTDAMFMAASRALAENSPLGVGGEGALLPRLGRVRELSQAIAFAVAKQAQEDGVALRSSDEVIQQNVQRNFWYPRYRNYRRATF
ncbi:MAG: oxaloacetate-decarboxylating malate dehydrogenase, partial [Salinisphaera sp.]|nr:oxaloacetate-decarboxylating malate dehydrogenase [Salinisphaera sp.]